MKAKTYPVAAYPEFPQCFAFADKYSPRPVDRIFITDRGMTLTFSDIEGVWSPVSPTMWFLYSFRNSPEGYPLEADGSHVPGVLVTRDVGEFSHKHIY